MCTERLPWVKHPQVSHLHQPIKFIIGNQNLDLLYRSFIQINQALKTNAFYILKIWFNIPLLTHPPPSNMSPNI